MKKKKYKTATDMKNCCKETARQILEDKLLISRLLKFNCPSETHPEWGNGYCTGYQACAFLVSIALGYLHDKYLKGKELT